MNLRLGNEFIECALARVRFFLAVVLPLVSLVVAECVACLFDKGFDLIALDALAILDKFALPILIEHQDPQ
jgi:hypothetical protein